MTTTIAQLAAAYAGKDPGAKYAAYIDSKTLGFGAAYVLESRANMFRATGDAAYLAKGAIEVDLILATAAANKDTHKPGWGLTSPMYGGVWVPYTVHGGGAFGAIAEWCLAARSHPDWKAKADATVAILVQHFATLWDAEIRPALHGGSVIILSAWNKYYLGIAPLWSLPPNQFNAWGRFLLKLFLLTGNTAYRDKAVALATAMKSTMWQCGLGWAWPYAATLISADPVFDGNPNTVDRYRGILVGAMPPKGYEWMAVFATDSSHANIDVNFIVDMANAGLVFTADDLAKTAWSFLNLAYSGTSKKVHHWMNGLGVLNEDGFGDNFSGWAALARANPAVGAVVWQLLNDPTVPAGGATYEAAVGHLALSLSQGAVF